VLLAEPVGWNTVVGGVVVVTGVVITRLPDRG
jgi:drug/metabolite transporter (DMT)-like permease